jgi:hypothetical protein
MIHDGSRVTYTGMGDGPLVFDDQGRVLVVSGHAAHVQWKTGALAGQVTLVDVQDLTPLGTPRNAVEAALDDSLEVSGLGTFTARQIYDEGGSEALLNAMVDSGHLAAFGAIAEEALALVAGRIRTSDAFRSVMAHLDESETEEVVRLASAALIRDAFTPD